MTQKNYKKQVLLFNIYFILSLIAATFLFKWTPGIAGNNFRPVEILSDVLKDTAAGNTTVASHKTNSKNTTNPNTPQRDYTTYQGLINTGGQTTALYDFYTHLHDLKNKKRKKIRIAYFGDSMIEGDLITQDLRRMLQETFGGSGVGFVPITSIVAGFRQTIIHSFSSNWNDVNYKSDNKNTAGLFLSGHSFFASGNSTVTYKSVNQPRLDNFNDISILFGAPANNGNPGADITVNDIQYKIQTNAAVNKLELHLNNGKELKLSTEAGNFPFYGVAFEADSGIVVDNFSFRGISGVELDYFTENYLKQIQQVRPYDLLIFQYGPNLLFKPNLTDFSWYTKKMQPTVQKLKNAFPNASLLLISTADKGFNYNGSWHTAKGVRPLIDAQYDIAGNTGVDFYNLFNAMGGEDAIVRWVDTDTALANKDYTHVNHRGAKKLAEIIFNAIMKEYKTYEEHVNQ